MRLAQLIEVGGVIIPLTTEVQVLFDSNLDVYSFLNEKTASFVAFFCLGLDEKCMLYSTLLGRQARFAAPVFCQSIGADVLVN